MYCADLKNRVLSSRCYEKEGQYFQLAAYALQADLGDWKEEVQTYFTPQDYFPPWVGHYVVQYVLLKSLKKAGIVLNNIRYG